MSIEVIQAFAEQLGDAIGRKAAETFTAEMRKVTMQSQPDPILTMKQAGARMGISEASAARLLDGGYLPRVAGFIERRVKQSDCDNYGKPATGGKK